MGICSTYVGTQNYHIQSITQLLQHLVCHISPRSAATHEEKQLSLFQRYMKKNNRAFPSPPHQMRTTL